MEGLGIALFGLFAYALGWVTAVAVEREDSDPFWRGFLDGLTFRRLWR